MNRKALIILGGAAALTFGVYLMNQNTQIGSGQVTSAKGVSLIKQREGLRLTRYQDVAGLWTIGYGHLIKSGENLSRITEAEATQLLIADLIEAQDAVSDLVEVDLTGYQFDALVSFVFNIGGGAFARSTMLKKLNAGDYAGASNEFGRWVYAGGQVSKGLQTRRASEAAQFRGQL